MPLLDTLMPTLPDGEIIEIRTGTHWAAVVVESAGQQRCGLASNPWHTVESAATLASLKAQASAQTLCPLVRRHDSPLASVGMAAINALLPHQPDRWVDDNAGDVIARYGRGKRVALVGHFPFVPDLRSQVGELNVLELSPREGDLPGEQAPAIIPQCEVVAITSMTFINGTLDSLLALCSPEALVIVLGPSTPLSPVLFEHRISLISGSIVEAIQPVLDGVEAGYGFRQIRQLGVRLVTIHAPQTQPATS